MNIQKFSVRYDELDPAGNVSVTTLLKYFAEAASADSESMSFGWDELQKKNLAWVLTHLQIFILTPHIKKQTVTVKTWHAFSDKLLSRREFIIFDEHEQPLLKGSSWWVLMDTVRRRVTRSLPELLALNPEKPEFLTQEEDFKRPLPQTEAIARLPIITRLEDLDINQHVNNAHFAAWALESVPEKIRTEKTLDKMLISYKNECRLGDTVDVFVHPEGEASFWHVLIRREDQKEVSRVFTAWK